MSLWRTKISTAKTTFTIFNHSDRFIDKQIHLFYRGVRINAEKHPKFLGTTLDPKLCFNKHLSELSIRCHKRLNALKTIKGKNWGAPSQLIIRAYNVLIRPILTTLSSLYSPPATQRERSLRESREQQYALHTIGPFTRHPRKCIN